MTEIGYVIQPGQSIPDDVIEFTDSDGAHAIRIEHPFQLPWRITECGVECATHQSGDFDFPLTVTAVREPAPVAELVHLRVPTVYGAACDSDLWQDPEESPDLWPQSTSDRDKVTCEACRATFTAAPDVHYYVTEFGPSGATLCGLGVEEDMSTTGEAGEATCTACRIAVDEEPTEPQPADVSPLLDLVRQLHDAIEVGWWEVDESGRYEAQALLGRIAEVLPQQPVQARNVHGLPWWIHICGATWPATDPGEDCIACNAPGPWRPLLVGGTWQPAKPGDTPGQLTPGEADGPQPVDLLVGGAPAPEPRRSACGSVNPPGGCNIHCPTLVIAQVMAELGVDRPEDVLAMIGELQRAIERACNERDEARAEVEEEIGDRDENAEWADRLAQAIAEYLRVDIGEHSNMNLPWQAALIALTDAVSPQQSDPLVLSLPDKTGGNVHRAVIELAILQGLMNRPLLKMEIGETFRTIDRIRALLVADLTGRPLDEGGAA